jgi:uncharacterized protein (DUF433 family)
MGGKPCIRGMRLTVGRILSQIGAGETIEELLADYPYLEREDVLQSLQYAAWLAEGREAEKSQSAPSAGIEDVRQLLQKEMAEKGTAKVTAVSGEGWEAHVMEHYAES